MLAGRFDQTKSQTIYGKIDNESNHLTDVTSIHM